MSLRIALFPCILSVSSAASAAEATPSSALAPGLLQTTLGLAAVLALIWGAAWLARRFSAAATSVGSPIKLVASQALGQRERVVLIELGDSWLLLGVAPGQVSTLHSGPKSTLPQATAPETMPFGRLLALARRKGRD